jgi:hypothetical protein
MAMRRSTYAKAQKLADLVEVQMQADVARKAGTAPVLEPVKEAPLIGTFFGLGCIFSGQVRDAKLEPMYWTRRFFTLLWIPILPLEYFLVSQPAGEPGDAFYRLYRFHAVMSGRNFRKIYGRATRIGIGAGLRTSAARFGVFLCLLIVSVMIAIVFRFVWRA